MDSQKEYKDVLLDVARGVYELVFGSNKDNTLLQRLRGTLRDLAAHEKKCRDYMKGQSVVSSDMQIPDEYKSRIVKYFRLDRKVTPPAILSTFTYKNKEGKENVVKSRSVYTHHRIVQSPSELTKAEAKQRNLIGLACIYDNCRVRIGKQDKINDSIVPEDDYDGIWRYISGEPSFEPYFYEGKAEFWKTALTSIQPEVSGKAEEAGGNVKRIVAAIVISFVMILLFELSIYFGPVTLVKNHPRSYGIQGSVICLIPCLIFGFFKPGWRKWWWGAVIAFLVGLLNLL